MNTNKLAGFLAVMTFAVLTADSAEAFYHAGMGRFLNRDPNGQFGVARVGGFSTPAGNAGRFLERDNPVGQPGMQVSSSVYASFGHPNVGDFQQFDPMAQYYDGMNLYQYARSSPVRYRDPSGLITAAECQELHDLCTAAARNWYDACKRAGGWAAKCNLGYGALLTECEAERAACLAASEEGLYCIGSAAVGTACVVISQCDSPLPGPADACAAGLAAWWFCPTGDPNDGT